MRKQSLATEQLHPTPTYGTYVGHRYLPQTYLLGFVCPRPFISKYRLYWDDLLLWSPNTLLRFFSGVETWLVIRCGIDFCPNFFVCYIGICGLSSIFEQT